MAEILSTENDVPIVFYGKLEDQFGNPVAGAQVAGNTTIYNGQRAGAEHVSTVSDGNGYFQISAGKGESLGVMPRKQGYALATGDTEFKYSHLYPGHFVPDPSNPVVIKLWKLQGAEPLLTIDQRYKLQCTPDPFNVDLVAGAIVPEGGDLRITINRPSGVISERSPQDWGFTVEARDGGLMESRGQGSVTFWAPEEGYQTSDTLSALSNRHGLGLIQQDLFIKSRNGKVYSKVFVSFKINEEPDGLMSVSFRGVANTNSSRNWEATAPQ